MAARSPYQATPRTDLARFIEARDLAHRRRPRSAARTVLTGLAELVLFLVLFLGWIWLLPLAYTALTGQVPQ